MRQIYHKSRFPYPYHVTTYLSFQLGWRAICTHHSCVFSNERVTFFLLPNPPYLKEISFKGLLYLKNCLSANPSLIKNTSTWPSLSAEILSKPKARPIFIHSHYKLSTAVHCHIEWVRYHADHRIKRQEPLDGFVEPPSSSSFKQLLVVLLANHSQGSNCTWHYGITGSLIRVYAHNFAGSSLRELLPSSKFYGISPP